MRPLAGTVLALLLAAPLAAQPGDASVALLVPDAEQYVGAPRGTPLAGQELFLESHRIGALLRCPVCQGMSIADSPAEMAVNMRGQVRDLLARGFSEEQILQYFELSYGQFVLLEPKFEGVTGMVWVLPGIALLLGVALVAMKVRQLERRPAAAAAAAPATAGEDPYLARVRDLVGRDEP